MNPITYFYFVNCSCINSKVYLIIFALIFAAHPILPYLGRYRNPIWDYFTKDRTTSQAQCLICRRQFLYTNNNRLSTLINHLSAKYMGHPKEFQEYLAKKEYIKKKKLFDFNAAVNKNYVN